MYTRHGDSGYNIIRGDKHLLRRRSDDEAQNSHRQLCRQWIQTTKNRFGKKNTYVPRPNCTHLAVLNNSLNGPFSTKIKKPEMWFSSLVYSNVYLDVFSANVDVKGGCRHRRRHCWTVPYTYDEVIYTAPRCIAERLRDILCRWYAFIILLHTIIMLYIVLFLYIVYINITREYCIMYTISMRIRTRSVCVHNIIRVAY